MGNRDDCAEVRELRSALGQPFFFFLKKKGKKERKKKGAKNNQSHDTSVLKKTNRTSALFFVLGEDRVQHVCTLCLAPPEEWIAIVCLFVAIISYALDIQRNCGQTLAGVDTAAADDDDFMGYSIIDHDVEDFS